MYTLFPFIIEENAYSKERRESESRSIAALIKGNIFVKESIFFGLLYDYVSISTQLKNMLLAHYMSE